MSKRAGNELSRKHKNILAGNSKLFAQSPFTVKNVVRKGAKHGNKLTWNEEVSCKFNDEISFIKLNDKEPVSKKCHYSKIALEPFGFLSLKETTLLKY